MTNVLALIWSVAGAVFLIMMTRLVLRKAKGHRFDAGDKITIGLIFLNWAHAATIHVVLTRGRDGMTEAYRIAHNISVEENRRLKLGSKLLLLGRTEIATFLWLQKCVLFLFYRPLVRKMRWERTILWVFWFTFAISYIAVVTATFAECRPVSRYWIVKGGSPGSCERGHVQLYVQGGFNMGTDIMLILLPIHVLFQVQRPLLQKIQLGLLFGLGVFVIMTTAIRLQQNSVHQSKQHSRTTWANAELVAATFVANAPTIYVCLRPQMKPGYGENSSGRIHVSRTVMVGSKEGSHDESLGTEVEIWTPERSV